MGSRTLYIDIGLLVIILVLLSFVSVELWDFAFSSLVGWSVGSLIFKYLDREKQETREGKRGFLGFTFLVVGLTIVGAILSNSAERYLGGAINSTPVLANATVHLWYEPANEAYRVGALLFFSSLSFLACSLALIDFRVKEWSQVHFPRCRKLRRLLRSERN